MGRPRKRLIESDEHKTCQFCGGQFWRTTQTNVQWDAKVTCGYNCERKSLRRKIRDEKADAAVKAVTASVIDRTDYGTLKSFVPEPVPEHLQSRIIAYRMRGAVI